jgi:hypothetical protein
MVVGYFRIARAGFIPTKAEPPLVIDTDAVLSNPIAFKGFKPVARRNAQILHPSRSGQYSQFSDCLSFNMLPTDGLAFLPKPFGILAGEGMNRCKNCIV